jgi:hypothetical protein
MRRANINSKIKVKVLVIASFSSNVLSFKSKVATKYPAIAKFSV